MAATRTTRRPTAAGVLAVVTGVVAIGGGIAIVLVGGSMTGLQFSTWLAYLAGLDVPSALSGVTILSPLLLGSLGAILIPFGVVSLTGGIQAMHRRHWRFALAGCLCASAVLPVLGLPAVVLVAMSRSEFDIGPERSREGYNEGP